VSPRLNEIWRCGESNLSWLVAVWSFTAVTRSRENRDATTVGKRREILGIRTDTALFFAGELAEKDQFNE
jgi:hypothetical protein